MRTKGQWDRVVTGELAMHLGGQGKPEEAVFELSLYEEQWAANQDLGKDSSR